MPLVTILRSSVIGKKEIGCGFSIVVRAARIKIRITTILSVVNTTCVLPLFRWLVACTMANKAKSIIAIAFSTIGGTSLISEAVK